MKGCILLITLCSLLLLVSQTSRGQEENVEDCPLNELDVDCVNPCNTCEYQKKTCPNADECIQGCDCKPGFLRNKYGYCIPQRFCVSGSQTSRGQEEDVEDCPLNELDVDCVNPCNTCEHHNKTCPSTDECIQGCECKPGFLRNKFGYCIPQRFCGKQSPGDLVAGDGRQKVWEEQVGEEQVREEQDSGGCPRIKRCRRSCRRRLFKSGVCEGFERRTCRCKGKGWRKGIKKILKGFGSFLG